MKRAALSIALACATALTHAGEPADAREATADLYARIGAGDLAGVARYLPTDGFTELSGDAQAPHRLDAGAFAGLFESGARIALRVVDVQEQDLGDTAVVTGVRVGAITPVGTAAVEMKAPFTMVWTRRGQGWQLRHVHLSAAVPVR